jgi:hypothetical protein
MNYRNDMNPIGSQTTNTPEYIEEFTLLSKALGELIKTHLETLPHTRARVYQVLNALAMQASIVLVGCDDEAAIEFFQDCLELSYDELKAKQEELDAEEGLPS